MKKSLIAVFAIVLTIGTVAPATLLIAPQTVYANDWNGDVPEWLSKAFDAITSSATVSTAGSTLLTQIKGFTLDPLAHLLAQLVLKSLTASIVDWINTGNFGAPNFVQNIGQYMLAIADNQALNFVSEITSQSNSPFASIIASSLRTNYLQGSSVAGFWAANQCTLSKVSPNINSYLAGNFSANGGWGAWFSLTTQPQNNPYSLYYRAQSELASRVGTVKAQQSQQLAANAGFLSWCNTPTVSSNGVSQVSVSGGALGYTTSGNTSTVGGYSATKGATNPGDSCVNQDGTTGTIATPGSIIHDDLSKALGSGVDSLVDTHDFDQMVDTILSALASKVLSSGLSALSSGGSGSFTSQLAGSSSSTNPNAASINSNINGTVQGQLAQAASYQSAWQTILAAAQTASSSVAAVIACENKNAAGGDPYGALAAQNTIIAPVFQEAAAASTSVANLNAAGAQVNADSASVTSGASGAAGALSADLQAFLAMPPSVSDVASAESNAQSSDAATSSSPVSLSVSGGSLVDQLNLLVVKAGNALQACESPLTAPI